MPSLGVETDAGMIGICGIRTPTSTSLTIGAGRSTTCSRVAATEPRRVVDLGCGPGNLTETLVQRWPGAALEAWDSSPEMVAAARPRA